MHTGAEPGAPIDTPEDQPPPREVSELTEIGAEKPPSDLGPAGVASDDPAVEAGHDQGTASGAPHDPERPTAAERRSTLLRRLSVVLFVAAGVLVVVAVLGAVFGGRHRSKASTLPEQATAGAAAGPAGGSSVASRGSSTDSAPTSHANGSVDPRGPVTGFGGTVLAVGPFAGFGEVAATLDQPGGTTEHPCLLAATDEPHRQRGLMGVTDPSLDGHAGMVFVYPVDQQEPFWMRNTPMPLSIAFYAADGQFVSSTDMAPCGDSPKCPNHFAAGPYAMTVEVPQGQLLARGFGPGSTLHLAGACPTTAARASSP